MIIAAMLMLAAQNAAPQSITGDAAPMTYIELHNTCMDGVGGNSAAIAKCQEFIYQVGRQLAYNEKNPGSCMAPARGSIDEITWAWLDYVAGQKTPPADESPAADSVMSALLLNYPCGWQER